MPLNLPGEISDAIIGCVEDKQTLRACALVCREWLPRSRHCLFRNIALPYQPDSGASYVALVKHVLHSETMRHYLHSTLAISIWGDASAFPWSTRAPSRLFLCDFTGHLPNLQHLTFVHVRWEDYLPLPREPLLLSGFPTVRMLSFHNCFVPSVTFMRRILASMPQLRELFLLNVIFTHPPRIASVQPIRLPRILPNLQTLSLPTCNIGLDPLLEWLTTGSPIQSTLRDLTFHYERGAPILVALRSHIEFLQAVAPGLLHLDLSLFGMYVLSGPSNAV